jgi:hypothetical protein
MIALILVVPGYYDPGYRNLDGSFSRPLLQRYRRLQPLQSVIAQPQEKLLSPGYASELCFYVGLSWCTSDEYFNFIARPRADESLADWLDERQITLVYLDEQVLSRPEIQPFLEEAAARHWSIIAFEQTPSEHWMFLRRDRPLDQDFAALKNLNTIPDITNPDTVALLLIDRPPWDARSFVGMAESGYIPSDGLLLGNGWGIPENTSIGPLRWVDNDAEIVLTAPTGQRRTMVLDLEAGPSLETLPLQLEVRRADGSVIQTLAFASRTEVQVTLPVTPGQGEVFTLHVVNDTDRPASELDARVLNFRVFRVGWLMGPDEAIPAE